MVEQPFRILKTPGVDIEAGGIADGPFETLAAAAPIAAVSVLALVRERDGRANRPLDDVFEPDELEAVSAQLEGKAEKRKNRHPMGTLAFAA